MNEIAEFKVRTKENKPDIWYQLEQECKAMANHAFAKGMKVPVNLMKILEQGKNGELRAEELTKLHNRLAELVAPAKPETIMLISDEMERGSVFLFLGRVPLIRRMMLVAIVSLITLIILSLSKFINNENMVSSMFDMEGERLLYVQAILLAAAAIGASFSALFKANSYVSAGCYDPNYESSYWVRFVVGLIAGIILTQLIPLNLDSIAEDVGQSAGGAEISNAALRISMALVGGFSANLVYKILDRIVETVQLFIIPPEEPELLKRAMTNQFNQEKLQFISGLTQEILLIQQKLAGEEYISQKKVQNLLSEYLILLSLTDEGIK